MLALLAPLTALLGTEMSSFKQRLGRQALFWGLIGAMGLVGVFAIFHGHAHGAEMPVTAGGLEYAAGFMAATALLHAIGIGSAMLVARLAGRYGRLVAQLAGGVFALGGIGVLAGWL